MTISPPVSTLSTLGSSEHGFGFAGKDMDCLAAPVSNTASRLVLLLAGAFLGVFLLWPLLESVIGAFVDPAGKFSIAYLVEVFRNPIYREGLWNAVMMGIWSR